MKDLYKDIYSIIVVGAWNIAIFTPEWIRENILTTEDYPQIYIEYPMNVMHSLRFSTDKFSFCIADNKLLFTLRTNSEVAARDIIETLRTICQKLQHTPVQSIGINFEFETDRNLISNSLLPGTQELIKLNGNILSTNITRSFRISDKETLNFKIISGEKNIYNFNYNFQVKKITDITDIISDDNSIIINKKEYSLKLLQDIYQDNME